MIPLISGAYGVYLLFSARRKLFVYEQGLVYHTAWFNLDASMDNVSNISVDVLYPPRDNPSGYRSATQVQLLILFSDNSRWVFQSSVYADLYEKAEALKAQWKDGVQLQK